LHFFEQPGVALPQYPGGLNELRAAGYIPGALQHIAFALPSAAAADALRDQLAAHGVEATPTGTIGPIQNLLFFDPHGLLLEATWPRPGTPTQPSAAA
jgi:catechol 2,3-dioxygenase-like lactoylglutathione lyase family enzyme